MRIENTINPSLNRVLKISLTMINQYFLHARILDDWGFEELGSKNYKFSIEAMKESDNIIKRVLFLEGLPNLQDLGKLLIGETVPEILQGNLTMEIEFRKVIQTVVLEAENSQDYVTRDHLKECLVDCEERLDYFETQLGLLEKTGSENYHQSII